MDWRRPPMSLMSLMPMETREMRGMERAKKSAGQKKQRKWKKQKKQKNSGETMMLTKLTKLMKSRKRMEVDAGEQGNNEGEGLAGREREATARPTQFAGDPHSRPQADKMRRLLPGGVRLPTVQSALVACGSRHSGNQKALR